MASDGIEKRIADRAKGRENKTAAELAEELRAADAEQQQAAQDANSDEARWTPDN